MQISYIKANWPLRMLISFSSAGSLQTWQAHELVSHVEMHDLQKICLHGVVTASVGIRRQIVHWNILANECSTACSMGILDIYAPVELKEVGI
jgi:hypothetical protein